MKNKIYIIFAAMMILVSSSAAAAIDKFPEYIGTNPFPECRLTNHCLGNLGIYDRLEDLENQECSVVTYGGGGGYGQQDVARDLMGDNRFFTKYKYFKDWLFETFATKDDIEQLYEYVELWMADGDTTQALLLKAIRLGHTITENGILCDPKFGCITLMTVK